MVRIEGNISDATKRLKRSASGLDISIFRGIKMLLGRLYGPIDLFLSGDEKIAATSSLLVGCIKNEFLYLSLR